MRLKFLIPIFAFSALFADDSAMNVPSLTKSESVEPIGDVAATTPPSQTSSRRRSCQPPCLYPFRVQIGGNYTYAWVTPNGSDTTKGNLGGVQTIVEYRPPDSFYGALAFNWRMGTTENSITERKIKDFNTQERFGFTFSRDMAKARLTLFTGFGSRYLPEEVIVGSSSVDFDYVEFYVPVGFLFEVQPFTHFSWGLNFIWMPQVFPTVRIDPLSGAFWDLTYEKGNFYAEMPFKFATCFDGFAVIVSPFVESWHDGHTTATTNTGSVLDLPANKYLFTGVNLNFAFSF